MPLNTNIINSIRPAKLPDLGANMMRQQQLMSNIMAMEKMRREARVVEGIRNAMASPGFDPSNPESLKSIISLGPEGAEVAKQLMGAQKLGGELREQGQTFGTKNKEILGAGMVNLMADASDAAIDYTEQQFKAAGFSPETYKPTLDLLRQLPDADARKQSVTQIAAGSTLGQQAMKALGVNLKEVKVGDQVVMLDDNPNSPTFNQEISRFTPSAKPVELKQQVVDSTLYNVNPYTGVAAEAPVGDVYAGRTPPAQTVTRTDSGVVSPYSAGPVTPVRMQPPVAAAPPAAVVQEAVPAMAAPAQPQFTPEDQARATDIVKGAAKTGRISAPDADFMRNVQGPDGAAAFDKWTQDNRIRVGGGIPAPRQTGAPKPPAPRAAITPAPRAVPVATQPAPAGNAPKTVAEAARQKSHRVLLKDLGYDPATGKDPVSELIAQSSSGARAVGENVMSFFTGEAPQGQMARGQLDAMRAGMTYEMLKGKLGAGTSDNDVRLVAAKMGDVANPLKPMNERLAIWQNVILPVLTRNAGYNVKPAAKGPPGASGKTKYIPEKAKSDLRNDKDPNARRNFDIIFGPGAAAKVLGR